MPLPAAAGLGINPRATIPGPEIHRAETPTGLSQNWPAPNRGAGRETAQLWAVRPKARPTKLSPNVWRDPQARHSYSLSQSSS